MEIWNLFVETGNAVEVRRRLAAVGVEISQGSIYRVLRDDPLQYSEYLRERLVERVEKLKESGSRAHVVLNHSLRVIEAAFEELEHSKKDGTGITRYTRHGQFGEIVNMPTTELERLLMAPQIIQAALKVMEVDQNASAGMGDMADRARNAREIAGGKNVPTDDPDKMLEMLNEMEAGGIEPPPAFRLHVEQLFESRDGANEKPPHEGGGESEEKSSEGS